MYKSLPYWTLDEALSLIRGLQPEVRKLGYHVCLGGGVLNKGESKKDLDLYMIALDQRRDTNATSLISYLTKLWGYGEDIGGGSGYPEEPLYPYKRQFRYDGLRVDVFVLGGVRNEVEIRLTPEEIEALMEPVPDIEFDLETGEPIPTPQQPDPPNIAVDIETPEPTPEPHPLGTTYADIVRSQQPMWRSREITARDNQTAGFDAEAYQNEFQRWVRSYLGTPASGTSVVTTTASTADYTLTID